jgi:large subunit ribosomal protein L25
MSAIKYELEAELRQDIGKGASRRLRHANKVPAVIYGAGETAVSLTLDHDKVVTALAHETFYSHILTLKMGKDDHKVILKDVQRHPAKPRVQHIDFLRIKADQKLHMHVPLHFTGEDKAPGVKEGGAFSHIMSDIEVSCFPADLPEHIEVDVSGMALNDTIHLTQLKLPKGVELVALAHGVEGHDLPVVSIHIPRIEEEVVETPEAVEGEAAAGEGAPAEDAEQPATEASNTKEKPKKD